MKYLALALSAATLGVALAPAASAQTTTAANATPLGGYQFGSGNDYAPANSVVTSRADGNGQTFQVYDRFHVRYQPTSASSATGVYSFALGSDVGFDFGFSNDTGTANSQLGNATVKLTDMLTGATSSFSPLLFTDNYFGNTAANGYAGAGNNVMQNSQPLGAFYIPFFSSNGFLFNSNVNDTYRLDFTVNGVTATAYAQFGTGAGAVPEPASWAMMILGMAAVGYGVRRRKVATRVSFAA